MPNERKHSKIHVPQVNDLFSLQVSVATFHFNSISSLITKQKMQVPVGGAIKIVKVMYECSPQHLHMGTAKMKEEKKDTETKDEG